MFVQPFHFCLIFVAGRNWRVGQVQQIRDSSAAKQRPAPCILLGVPPPLYKRKSVMSSMIQWLGKSWEKVGSSKTNLFRQTVVNQDLPRRRAECLDSLRKVC